MNYSKTWQMRFDFYEANGLPGNKSYNQAFRKLPLMQRLLFNMNFGAFFLGFIYFFIIGRPKLAVSILLLHIGVLSLYYGVLIVFQFNVPVVTDMAINIALGLIFAQIANVAYYKKMIKGEADSLNPFKYFSLV